MEIPPASTGMTIGAVFRRLRRAGADLASGAIPNWHFDLLHAHDWQAGMAPAYLRFAPGPGHARAQHHDHPQHRLPGTVHRSIFDFLGLPPQANDINGVEYYGGIGFLKAGLANADAITTVSPTYAKEIRDPGFGMGLEGLIRARSAVVSGIVNGIDMFGVESPLRHRRWRRAMTRTIWKAARSTRRPSKPASASRPAMVRFSR